MAVEAQPRERPGGLPDGCSGKMDAIARVVNLFRTGEKGRKLAFTGCCDEHDVFYEQGGSPADRAFADKVLRDCISENLERRGRSFWVRLHVPFLFWAATRSFGWLFWHKQ